MAPIQSAKVTLTYPLYGADFDPLHPNVLLVGGGGGEGRSGVGNKITLLNSSLRSQLSELIELDLSREEDSVTSLAVALSSETSFTAYAGVNSSEKDQQAGKNEHLRSFRLNFPPKKPRTEKSDPSTDTASTSGVLASEGTPEGTAEKPSQYNGTIEPLGQVSFFKPSSASKKETYQRLIRLSQVREGRQRIAAIATGLATESEIVVFRAVSAPQKSDVLVRINLDKDEAVDLDLIRRDEELDTLLAYCTNYEVYASSISSSKSASSPESPLVYALPSPKPGAAASGRRRFRSLRFLTPRHILLLSNRPQRTGAELMILYIPKPTSTGTISTSVTLNKRLNKKMKAAVGLDICHLSPSPDGVRQIIIAVAGQDGSIEILTLEFSKKQGMLSKFNQHSVLKDVHPASITKICFSTFSPPAASATTQEVKNQCVKLASVSVGQTAVVHTLRLEPSPSAKSPNGRYVLTPAKRSEIPFSIFMAILTMGVFAFLLQIFVEIRGAQPTLGAVDWLSPGLKDILSPYIIPYNDKNSLTSPLLSSSGTPIISTVTDKLSDLVTQQLAAETPKAIVMRDDGTDQGSDISAELHHDDDVAKQEELKKWEDLPIHQKERWKKKLSAAGHWTADQGESILKGVFFSEVAGLVGNIVRGGG